jgi:hypothetical protein
MAKLFHELRERLLQAGVAPRHVRRYLGELADHLTDLIAEEECAGKSRAEAEAAALTRLGSVDDLTRAMIQQRQFQSWSARAPWATFGVGSLLIMSAAYFLACLYLWCGWQMFMPRADTPFGPSSWSIYDFPNIYFQGGKFFYEVLPILVGWGIGLMAVRQRMMTVWPMIASALIAWMGATAQIQASRTLVLGLGHIRMKFLPLSPADPLLFFRFFAIFTIGLLPYLVWRIQRHFSQPA